MAQTPHVFSPLPSRDSAPAICGICGRTEVNAHGNHVHGETSLGYIVEEYHMEGDLKIIDQATPLYGNIDKKIVRTSIADSWVVFQRLCIPPEAPPQQSIEMRRAYYAGIAWVFDVLSEGLDEDVEATDGDLTYMEKLYKELEVFAKDLQEGRT